MNNIEPFLKKRLRRIQSFIFNLNGIFYSPAIFVNHNNEIFRSFYYQDILSLKMLKAVKINLIAVVYPEIFLSHCNFFKNIIPNILEIKDPSKDLLMILDNLNSSFDESLLLAYSLEDLPLMDLVHLKAASVDAFPEVKSKSHYITLAKGGNGAITEISRLILEYSIAYIK